MEYEHDYTRNKNDASEANTGTPGEVEAGAEVSESVGYGKPPKASQFKKGKSGNPMGRPVKPKFTALGATIGAKLEEDVTITVEGSKRKLSRLRLLMRSLVEDAANGNKAALMYIIRTSDSIEGEAPPIEPNWLIFPYNNALSGKTPEQLDEAFFRQNEKDVARWTRELKNGGTSLNSILHLELTRKVPAKKSGKLVRAPMYEVIASRLLKDAHSDVQVFKLLQKIVPNKKYKRDYSRIEYLRPTRKDLDAYGGSATPRPGVPKINETCA